MFLKTPIDIVGKADIEFFIPFTKQNIDIMEIHCRMGFNMCTRVNAGVAMKAE
jgi:hypothetical protein